MAQSMASTSVTNGSSWRSWRPGYWIASSSTSAGRRASQPRKVPALPPAGGSAIRRRRGCALPLRCNHRARARSVAGGNGGASAAWQRRTTSRASGSPYEGSIEPQSIAWKVADSAQAAAVYLVERNPVLLERHGIDMQAWRERHREIREALLAAEQAPEAEPAPLEEPPEPRRQRKRKTPASGKGD